MLIEKEGMMKKYLNSKIILLVAILTVVFIFVGINLLEARKPTSDVQWGIQLPDKSYGLNLYGSGNTYWNDGENIGITVKKSRGRPLYYHIRFFVYETDKNWVGFQNIDITEDCLTGDGKPCGLPSPYNGYSAPECVEYFMNNGQHPVEGYQHFMIHFYIYEDIESFTPEMGDVPLLERSWGQFFLWNRFNCDDPFVNPPMEFYHTITGKLGNPCSPGPSGCFFIRRNDDDSWTISYSNEIQIDESYCEKELYTQGKGKKKKTYYIDAVHHPLVGQSEFSLELNLVRRPIL